jgi:hypothetical protein
MVGGGSWASMATNAAVDTLVSIAAILAARGETHGLRAAHGFDTAGWQVVGDHRANGSILAATRTMASKQAKRKRESVQDHGPQIKDDEQYEALRREGMSKEKAARIANTPRQQAAQRGGRSPKYEEWNKDDLYDKAKQVGIAGRSNMNKAQLIDALRNH